MDKIIPMKFTIEKNNETLINLADFNNINTTGFIKSKINESFSHPNLTSLEEGITISGPRSIIRLEGGGQNVIWNLKEIHKKSICPRFTDLEDTNNIITGETNLYNIVCINMICCDSPNEGDQGIVVNGNNGIERLPLNEDDRYSRIFQCGIAISKNTENEGNRYSGYIFGLKKGSYRCLKPWADLIKSIYESCGFIFTGVVGTSRQKLRNINTTIKSMVVSKKYIGSVLGGGIEGEYTLEVGLKSKNGLNNIAEKLLNKLIRGIGTDNINIELLNNFWEDSMSEENVRFISKGASGDKKTLGIDIDRDEFITFMSNDFSPNNLPITLHGYLDSVLSYLNSLAND